MQSVASRALFIATVVLLQGCAGGIISMTPATRAEMKQSLVVHTVRYRSEPMNGVPLAVDMESEYGISDPATEIGRKLAETLRNYARMGNVTLEAMLFPRPVQDISYYQARYQTGMVLEVIVEGHAATRLAGGSHTYGYGLGARGRLIRLFDGKVLWLDRCDLDPSGDDSGARRLDVSEFEANKAARLKEIVRYSNELCARIFADKILGAAR